jgi:hypothetical protein
MALRTAAALFTNHMLVAAATAGAMLLAGCSGGKAPGTMNTGGSGSSEPAVRSGQAHTSETIAQLDRQYVVGPTIAGELNYRIAWQYESPSASPLKAVALRGDSFFTLDQQNFLTRINIADGKARWRIQAADPVLDVISLNIVDDRAFLTAGSEMLVFDANNGSPYAKWRFEKVAGTQPVEYGDYLIYGSRGGEVVWIARRIGHFWRGYAIAPAIRVPPVIKDNLIAAVGSNGALVVLDAGSATKVWDKRLLDAVVCKPVFSDEALYVAGQDQYLWAFDIGTGRTLWKVLQEAPLTSSPTLIGDRLYQQVPGSGLACYNALPIDSPGGEFLWRNDGVTGNVILERRGELFAWDPASKNLSMLETSRGLTKKNFICDQAEFLIVGGETKEDLFAASKDGRVVRLVSRN